MPLPSSLVTLRAVVFDLDGTLIDSYAAIIESLNHAMAALGHPPLPATDVRQMVGRGLQVLPRRPADGCRAADRLVLRRGPGACGARPAAPVVRRAARLASGAFAGVAVILSPAQFGSVALREIGPDGGTTGKLKASSRSQEGGLR